MVFKRFQGYHPRLYAPKSEVFPILKVAGRTSAVVAIDADLVARLQVCQISNIRQSIASVAVPVPSLSTGGAFGSPKWRSYL